MSYRPELCDSCGHVWVMQYWWDEPPTMHCHLCGMDRGDYEHDMNLPPWPDLEFKPDYDIV